MNKLKIKTKILLIALLSIPILTPLLLNPTLKVLAQTEETSSVEELEQKEREREEDFLSQLLLDIPIQTDNPSHIITFVDPSEEKEGIKLEIDEKGLEEITSPYSLPALGIGKHNLKFQFVDKYGSTQILEKEIIVIPRPPIINSPIFEQKYLLISGTGLSNSDLILILSSDRNILVKETQIDDNGSWQIEVDNEELEEGVFTFTAFTRRYGYASNLAESTTFEIGNSDRVIFDNGREIYFSFGEVSLENIGSILSQNIDLGLLVGGAFILGFLISLLIFSIVKGSLENRSVRVFENKIKNNKKEGKELTLKERLSKEKAAEEEKEGEKKEEKKKKEKTTHKKKSRGKKQKKGSKNKTEKILTKIDFLKDYKKFDPDDKHGKEKENIDIEVTSKE